METEPERLKLLGTCGMFGQSFRVISARKKLFAQITLALILPLCLFLLAQSRVTQLVLENTIKTNSHNGEIKYDTSSGGEYAALLDTRYGWALTLVIKVAYFTVVIVLSLLSTSAVVYAVACLYTSKDVTFKKVMRAVPKVWKRLVVTFFWIFIVFFVFTLIFVALFVCAALLVSVGQAVGVVLAVLVGIVYIIGIFYIMIIFQLACVVSVLEDVYGRKAMSKSRALLKGKLWSVVGCFVLLSLCYGAIQFGFEFLIAASLVIGVVSGIAFWFVLALETLLSLVVSTVIYFVCKSYHHQGNLEMSGFGNRLEVYHDAKQVPLEQSNV